MDTKEINCSHCGSALESDARYCKSCGKPVEPQAATASPSPRNRKTFGLIIGILAVVLIAQGCCALIGGVSLWAWLTGDHRATATPTTVQSQVVNQPELQISPTTPSPAQATPSIKPTKLPTATPSAMQPSPTNQPTSSAGSTPASRAFSQDGVHFMYDPFLAEDAFLDHVPATGSFGDPLFAVSPAHRSITLSGYPVSDSIWEPQIRILPVEDYYALAPDIAEAHTLLQIYIDSGDIDTLTLPLPFFPPQNAGQMLAAKPAFLDFANGSGIRYITQFSSDISPVDNTRLLYTFQGLTGDGEQIVSVTMPISNDALPDPAVLLNDPNFAAIYDTHLDEMYQVLENTPDNDYLPTIQMLDDMVRSLQVD